MPFDSSFFFSPKFRSALGRYTLYTAIFSFLVHLGLIALKEWAPQLVQFELLAHPINAIYTPFSILLIFESYLLIFYLRKSTTYYIAKQYEIIALILIRGIFKDMTHLDLAEASASSSYNLELLRDLLAVAFVFVLIYWFYSNSGIEGYKSLDNMEEQALEPRLKRFVQSKKILSVLLLGVFVFLALQSLVGWVTHQPKPDSEVLVDINAIFFDKFFTILILSDVFILLFSLMYTEEFPVIIRNSSFVISTILLKVSFTAEGWMAQLLIVVGVGFGVLMLYLSNAFDRMQKSQK